MVNWRLAKGCVNREAGVIAIWVSLRGHLNEQVCCHKKEPGGKGGLELPHCVCLAVNQLHCWRLGPVDCQLRNGLVFYVG